MCEGSFSPHGRLVLRMVPLVPDVTLAAEQQARALDGQLTEAGWLVVDRSGSNLPRSCAGREVIMKAGHGKQATGCTRITQPRANCLRAVLQRREERQRCT